MTPGWAGLNWDSWALGHAGGSPRGSWPWALRLTSALRCCQYGYFTMKHLTCIASLQYYTKTLERELQLLKDDILMLLTVSSSVGEKRGCISHDPGQVPSRVTRRKRRAPCCVIRRDQTFYRKKEAKKEKPVRYDVVVCMLHIKCRELKQLYWAYAISTNIRLLLGWFFLPDICMHRDTGELLLYSGKSSRKFVKFHLTLSSLWPFSPPICFFIYFLF